MAALEVKAGEKIKASQYNQLAQSISIQNGSNQTPFRATKEGMLFNGGATSYDTKAKSQNYKLLECRIGRGVIPEKFDNAGSEFYGAFVNVAGFLHLAAFTANSQAGGPQVFEGLYIKDPTASTLKFVGFDIIGLNQTPSQVGFQNCSNIWCPVAQLKWDELSQMFKGGTVYLRCLQLFNSTSEKDNGATVLVLDDGYGDLDDSQAIVDAIINAIRSASGYKAVDYVDSAIVIDQHELFTPMEGIFDTSKPASTPYTMFDGTATLVNNSDSAMHSKSMLRSLETTAPEQYGMDSNGQLSAQTYLRGSHSNSLYHFGQYHSDFTALDWNSSLISAVDVLVKVKYPHPNQGTFPAYDDRAAADLAYVTLSAFAPGTVDSEISDLRLSSVQTETWTDPDTGNDIKYHQLFGFERAGLRALPPLSDYQDSLEVVLRDSYTTNGNGAIVNYVNLSSVIAAAAGGAETDAETTDLSSINRVTGGNALQLLDFDKGDCVPWESLSSKHYADLVIRRRLSDGNPATKVDYIDFNSLMDNYIWKEYIGDSQNQNLAQRSVNIQQVGNDTNHYYAQLYNIANPTPGTATAALKYGQTRYLVKNGSGENPDHLFQIVSRDASNGVEVKYDNAGIYLPKPSISDVDQLETILSGIVGQISSISDISADLTSMLSNYWKCGGTYNNNCYGESIGNSRAHPEIDLDNGRLLYENANDPTLDWHNCYLMWNYGEVRLNWNNCETYDSSAGKAMDWDWRYLYDDNGNVAVRWNNRTLHDSNQLGALDWKNRTLYDSSNHIVADWERKELLDSNTIPAVDWGIRQLKDSAGNGAVDWNGRELLHDWKVDGDLSLGNGQQLKIGSTTLNENQLQRLLALI